MNDITDNKYGPIVIVYASGVGLLGSRLQRRDVILRTLTVRTQHVTLLCSTLLFYFIRS